MSFKSSDYLGRLAKMQHSDYVSGYMQLGEVLKTLSIHPQSFEISKLNFFDSPISELTSSGVKYTRAPLGARGKSACSMKQTCQVNWTITIPKNTLAIQLNKTFNDWNIASKLIARTNFNGKEDALADWTTDMSQAEYGYFGKSTKGIGGALGAGANYYARSDHQHPINVDTNASNIPIVNGVETNGSSAFYARQDHIYPPVINI
ncbi:MAG: hypothetical protein EZS28_051888 [Streblomastix strix]|uniref:Uncharacterized protein n=1 Tax=Streblomastix strix TaxID=222440 RepID=A0A5J4SXC9_9EUKA|nr:MAG: hypothetical protein EZS28_051888 [Streblomastix strix]